MQDLLTTTPANNVLNQAAVTLNQCAENNECRAALNVLCHLAKGKPLSQIDPDDLWHFHGWLEEAMNDSYELFKRVDRALMDMGYEPPEGPYIH